MPTISNSSPDPKFSKLDFDLDKGSPVPLYFQIERILEIRIRSGLLAPGEKLPTEAQLGEQLDVSRTVIRQAIKGLQDKDLVWRSPGKGTFVTEKKISQHLMQQLSGFFEDTIAHGSAPKSRILAKEIIQVSGKIADKLQLFEGDSVMFLHRLRFRDDEPMVISRTYVPFERFPGLFEEDLATYSLYALIEKHAGKRIDRSHRTLEGAIATHTEANLLGIGIGNPLILIRSITYLADGTPVEYDIGLHRGDRLRFEVEVYRDEDRQVDFDLYGEDEEE